MQKLAQLVLQRPITVKQIIKTLDPRLKGLLPVSEFSKAVVN